MKKRIWVIALIVLVLWTGAYFINSRSNDSSNKSETTSSQQIESLPRVNFRAPDFTATGLDSKTYSLADSIGKPVIVNFWASWCGPCKLEAGELSSIYDKYKGKVMIYGVNLTYTENSLSDVQAFAANYHYNFPVLLDKDGSIAKEYKIQPIPDTFFINKEGIIVDKIIGYGGEGALTEKAKKLVSDGGSHE